MVKRTAAESSRRNAVGAGFITSRIRRYKSDANKTGIAISHELAQQFAREDWRKAKIIYLAAYDRKMQEAKNANNSRT